MVQKKLSIKRIPRGYTPAILPLTRMRQEDDHVFTASLNYIESSRPTRATVRTCLEKERGNKGGRLKSSQRSTKSTLQFSPHLRPKAHQRWNLLLSPRSQKKQCPRVSSGTSVPAACVLGGGHFLCDLSYLGVEKQANPSNSVPGQREATTKFHIPVLLIATAVVWPSPCSRGTRWT